MVNKMFPLSPTSNTLIIHFDVLQKSIFHTRIYDQGHEVVGLDGVEKPILEFFQEQGLTYTKGSEGAIQFYIVSYLPL